MELILEAVRTFDGVFVLAPGEGSEFPDIAWGDSFFYYAPDGQIPHVQPYATIVTKDYPDDALSELGRDGRWRVNIHVGRAVFTELTGESRGEPRPHDFAAVDVFLPHPVYGALGWVCVVNPGDRTMASVLGLLRDAHDDARRRVARRAEAHAGGDAAASED